MACNTLPEIGTCKQVHNNEILLYKRAIIRRIDCSSNIFFCVYSDTVRLGDALDLGFWILFPFYVQKMEKKSMIISGFCPKEPDILEYERVSAITNAVGV